MQYRIESEGLDKFFYQGVDLANQIKYQEALSKFEKSLKKNPHHIPTYRNIAYLHLSLNQYDQLVKSMDKAIKSSINDSGIWHYKGYALKLLNKIDKAIESLNNSLKCDPEDCDTLLLLGNTHRILKNYELAFQYYDDALSINPLYDLVRNNKLSILQELGNKDAIEKFLEETTEFYHSKALENQNSEKYLASAILYRKAIRYFNYAPAIENIKKVISILDKKADLYSKFGFEFYQLNKWKNQGLFFLDMGDVGNVAIDEIQEKLKEFIIQEDIPIENMKMIPFDLMGKNRTLLGIEIIPGIFKKFNSIYNLPYFVFDSSYRFGACAPSQVGSLKKLIEEYGIKQIKLSIWHDITLDFYELGPLKVTISEMYERIYLLKNHLKIDLGLFKMFPLKNILVVAIEKFPGAYNAFQQKTGLEPIRFEPLTEDLRKKLT